MTNQANDRQDEGRQRRQHICPDHQPFLIMPVDDRAHEG